MSYTLYWYPETASFGPHAVLAEGQIPHELILVDIKKGESRTPEYLAINPGGHVPALRLEDGSIVTEAAATMLFLAEQHNLKELLPHPEEAERGVFYRSLFFLTNMVQEAYRRYYYASDYSTDPAAVPGIQEAALATIKDRWRIVNEHLSANGPYHLGDRYSLPDLYMVMLVSWYPETPDVLSQFPAIKLCYERVIARPLLKPVLDVHGIE